MGKITNMRLNGNKSYMISDAIKLALIKTAPTLSHIELIELVEQECELTQQRKPLTNEQIWEAVKDLGEDSSWRHIVDAIEAAHGIKENK